MPIAHCASRTYRQDLGNLMIPKNRQEGGCGEWIENRAARVQFHTCICVASYTSEGLLDMLIDAVAARREWKLLANDASLNKFLEIAEADCE
jgi:hypothetical protein